MRQLCLLIFILAAVPAFPASAQDLDVPEGGYVVSSDLSLLPAAVRAKRDELLAIAGTGDISALTPVLETDRTTVSFGDPEDRTASLVQSSADGEGIEVLAILTDVLSTSFAAMDGGDGSIVYVWPSLAAFESLSELTPDQLVDAYRIMGYAAFEEMRGLDAWYHWRAYIGADGRLQAFVAGD